MYGKPVSESIIYETRSSVGRSFYVLHVLTKEACRLETPEV